MVDLSVVQGMVTSRLRGVWAISGAVTEAVSAESGWLRGQSKDASVAFTGSSGVSAHRITPSTPATMATVAAVPTETRPESVPVG